MKIRRGSSYAEPENPQEALGDENTKGKFICGARKSTRGLEPLSYRGALLSTLLHANVYVFTQFAECTSRDCK
jgi:hypothetical protein